MVGPFSYPALMPTSQPLTERERKVLDFAGLTFRHDGARDMAIRDEFKTSAHLYFQELHRLLERPEALAYAPVTVNRLRRVRDDKRQARSVRKLQQA